MLNNARRLDDLRIPPANRLEALKARDAGSTAFVSTTSGASVFAGTRAMRRLSKLLIRHQMSTRNRIQYVVVIKDIPVF